MRCSQPESAKTSTLALQVARYRFLEHWFHTAQGHRIACAFASELDALQPLQGESLLQLGNCGQNLWLPSLDFKHKWIVSPYEGSQRTHVVTVLNGLPLDRDSVDCILAPLTMNVLDEALLDEMDRVLKSMGHLIFFGINPWSFWGFRWRWNPLHSLSTQLTSSFRLKRALNLRGYQTALYHPFYYIPPVQHEEWIQKLEVLNEMGKMIKPFPAGFYCLIVQKHQTASPSLIKESFSKGEKIIVPSLSS